MNALERLLQENWLPVLRGIQTSDSERSHVKQALGMVLGIPRKGRDQYAQSCYLNAIDYLGLSEEDIRAYVALGRSCRALQVAETHNQKVRDLGDALPRRYLRRKKDEQQFIGTRGTYRYRLYAHTHPFELSRVYASLVEALVGSKVCFDSKIMTNPLMYNGPGIILPQYNGIVVYANEEAGRVALQALSDVQDRLLESKNPFTAQAMRGVGIAECFLLGSGELRTSFDVPKHQALWNVAKDRAKMPAKKAFDRDLDREMKSAGRQPRQYHLVDEEARSGSKNCASVLYRHYVETLREDLQREKELKLKKQKSL